MLTSIDKALTGFLAPIAGFMASAVLDPEKTPMDVVADPNMWLMALATGVLVWAVPNKGFVNTNVPPEGR